MINDLFIPDEDCIHYYAIMKDVCYNVLLKFDE